MKNIILASTSTLFGAAYLAYLEPVIRELFEGVPEIIFIPYARPGGCSVEAYTEQVAGVFHSWGIAVKGLHQFSDPVKAIAESKGIFTGGGNTFLLVKQLYDLQLMDILSQTIEKGVPYLGTSAGSNIAGINMKTTNDMPIVYPSGFTTLGLVPFNLNPHYLDPDPNSTHNGETRETRIKEFHTQNTIPVVGLREGSWIKVSGDQITTEGSKDTRIFKPGIPAYEISPGTRLLF